MLFNPRREPVACGNARTNVEVLVATIRTHYLGYMNDPLLVPCFRPFGQRAHTHNDNSLRGGVGYFRWHFSQSLAAGVIVAPIRVLPTNAAEISNSSSCASNVARYLSPPRGSTLATRPLVNWPKFWLNAPATVTLLLMALVPNTKFPGTIRCPDLGPEQIPDLGASHLN